MSKQKPFVVEKPLLIMFKQDDRIMCHIHKEDTTHEMYGLMICDVVRHAAKAYKVSENEIWKWVELERSMPTTDISQVS